MKLLRTIALTAALLTYGSITQAQSALGVQLAELGSLREKVKNADTRTRVAAFHRAWSIALESDSPEVKTVALELMREPVASASDHIRMPAVYAIAEVANSTTDVQVKSKALASLREPLIASQLPIRLCAIDAVNSIMRSPHANEIALQAVQVLGEPVRSGNNGVRIPAINSVSHIAEVSSNDRVYSAAIDLMEAPLDSMAMIGGMEVRLMAVVALERLGSQAPNVATKAKALGMLQAAANSSGWEPEAKNRVAEAAGKIQRSMDEKPKNKPANQASS